MNDDMIIVYGIVGLVIIAVFGASAGTTVAGLIWMGTGHLVPTMTHSPEYGEYMRWCGYGGAIGAVAALLGFVAFYAVERRKEMMSNE